MHPYGIHRGRRQVLLYSYSPPSQTSSFIKSMDLTTEDAVRQRSLLSWASALPGCILTSLAAVCTRSPANCRACAAIGSGYYCMRRRITLRTRYRCQFPDTAHRLERACHCALQHPSAHSWTSRRPVYLESYVICRFVHPFMASVAGCARHVPVAAGPATDECATQSR